MIAPATPAGEDLCRRGRGRPRDERASRAITEAARRQLAELGYARLSMESVAAEAGVARATVYRRYRDKADLVTAALADQDVLAEPGPSDDPRRDLVAFLTGFDARFAEHCLEVLGALLGAHEEPRALALHRRRVIEPRMAHARSLLLRAQELGQLDASADVDVALQMLVGAVFARRVTGAASERGWARRAVDAVWEGMAPARR